MDSEYYLLIALTFFGFIALAFILLFPVYRFLRREEKVSEEWTDEAIARRQRRERPSGDGAPGGPPSGPPRTP